MDTVSVCRHRQEVSHTADFDPCCLKKPQEIFITLEIVQIGVPYKGSLEDNIIVCLRRPLRVPQNHVNGCGRLVPHGKVATVIEPM